LGTLIDAEAIKERQREIWGLGDYSLISRVLRPAAVALCDACAVSAGQEVLDVAAGDGNFALACAHEGARVVASDIAPVMVERGRARSDAEGYAIEWVEADAEELPFDDASFDCVGSVFGAMLAPRPEVAAGELFRVVRPGGTVGMTAWTPESFAGQQFAIGRKYAPSQPDQPLAVEWGAEETIRERFHGLTARVELDKRTLAMEAGTPEELVAKTFASAGSWENARRTLPRERFEAMEQEAIELVRSRGGDGPVRIDNEYVVIVARRRG
jgi:ubiquinone/menaquinone biosynthesis C-methylase UbiE